MAMTFFKKWFDSEVLNSEINKLKKVKEGLIKEIETKQQELKSILKEIKDTKESLKTCENDFEEFKVEVTDFVDAFKNGSTETN